MPANQIERQVIYNMIERTVHNHIQGMPVLSVFEGNVVNYIIRFINPYLDVFSDEQDHLDIDQLADYTSYEVNEKIKRFKENYKREVSHED